MISADTIDKSNIERDLLARAAVVSSPPYYYQVHLNKLCNQKCIMCMPDGRHPHDEMPLDQFFKFFEQIKPYAEHLTLLGGEPLLYRWIDTVLEHLSRSPIAVTLITNATALTDTVAKRLTSLHELDLRCSVNAASRSTYFKIHGTNHFDRVASQVKHFADLSRHKPNIHLILHFVVMRENLCDVLDFVDFAKDYHPHRVEFHPVRHVSKWEVSNDTGWQFQGSEQSCESFKDEYNDAMTRAKLKCEAAGLAYEVLLLK